MRTRLRSFLCLLTVVVVAISTASALQMNSISQRSQEGLTANVTDQATSCSHDKNNLTPSMTPPPGCGPLNKSDWPQWMHDAGHSGYNPDERVIDPSNVGRLQALWWMYNPFGDLPYTYVVANGMLYVLGFDYITWQRGLFAVKGTTGGVFVVKWMIPDLGCVDPYKPRLVVDGGIVYFYCEGSVPGLLYFIDAASGVILDQWHFFISWLTFYNGGIYTSSFGGVSGPGWSYEIEAQPDCWPNYSCGASGPAVVDNGVALWNYGYWDWNTGQCLGRGELAFKAVDGSLLWGWGALGDCDMPEHTMAGGILYTAGLYARTARNDQFLWSLPGLGMPVISSPAGKPSSMGFAACGADLCAFSTLGGKIIWTAPGGGAPLAAANGVVYAGGGAYDAKTGRWLGAVTSGMVSGFVANGMAYVSDTISLTAYGPRK